MVKNIPLKDQPDSTNRTRGRGKQDKVEQAGPEEPKVLGLSPKRLDLLGDNQITHSESS